VPKHGLFNLKNNKKLDKIEGTLRRIPSLEKEGREDL
jgi:hypothetical protein